MLSRQDRSRADINSPYLFVYIWYSSFSFLWELLFLLFTITLLLSFVSGFVGGCEPLIYKELPFYWFSEGIPFVCIITSFSFTIPCHISGFVELDYLSLHAFKDLCAKFLISIFFHDSMQREYSWCCYYDSGRVSKYASHFANLTEASQQRIIVNLMCRICFHTTRLFSGWNRHLLSVDSS